MFLMKEMDELEYLALQLKEINVLIWTIFKVFKLCQIFDLFKSLLASA